MYTTTDSSRVLIDWSRPDDVRLRGIATRGVTLVHADRRTVVVKTKGYAKNPGSRHSGPQTYYPPETIVYLVPERKTETSGWGYAVARWENRRRRK